MNILQYNVYPVKLNVAWNIHRMETENKMLVYTY